MSFDLAEYTGLPLRWEEPDRLLFADGLPEVKASVRPWEELRPVLKDPSACPRGTAYFMYRDISWPTDRPLLEKEQLRYDITVIPAARAGDEPVRTHGHYHALVPGQNLTYPEMYQVVHGEAWFLLQQLGHSGHVARAVVFRAGAGDYVLVPPDFGHVTVNTGAETLVIANWVQRHFASSFEEMRRLGGAAYHVVRANDGGKYLVPNPAYGHPVPLQEVDAFPLERLGFPPGRPSYVAGIENPTRLRFLVQPQDHRQDMALAWTDGGIEEGRTG